MRRALCPGSVTNPCFPPAWGGAPLTSVTLCCPHVVIPGPASSLPAPRNASSAHQACLLALSYGPLGSKRHQEPYVKRVDGHFIFLIGL